MKFKVPVTLNVLSPMSLRRPSDFLNAVRTHCDLLPELLPEKWGWWEPLDRSFNLNDVERLIASGGECDTVYWERKQRPKAFGQFGVRWISKSPRVRDTHSHIDFTTELNTVPQEDLVNYIKAASVRTRAHFAMLDGLVEPYRDFSIESASAQSGQFFFVATHVLRHWLPDVFWGTVFGGPYVELFGKDKLLSAPAAVVEEIADDMVYIQLTDNLTASLNDPGGLLESRAKFKTYLGVDAFFERGRGYDRAERGPIGDIFSAPTFHLDVDD
ncbi:Uncharacterised protein [Burkholderia pseudomallei]|nr:Uncharacterised protein [Burkholderia pseudomallei]